jgi:CheY-like chemotaxis protein
MQTHGTILLVEDDKAIRRYLQVILERCGYSVIAAEDGLEAMKLALSSEIDAVVTDAVMPHVNGHELCRFFRRNPKYSKLPLIMMSGHQKVEPMQESDSADVYLSKPVSQEELTECLSKLLEREEPQNNG